MRTDGFPPAGVPSGTSMLVSSSTCVGGLSRKASSSTSHPEPLESDTVCPSSGCPAEVHDPRRPRAPSPEEALEDLVHQKRWPDEGLEDGQQVLAERVGLLPEEHQRTNQT